MRGEVCLFPRPLRNRMSSDAPGAEDECIDEDVTAFLHSRRWEAEVGSFVDERCVTFAGADHPRNPEHRNVHVEYCRLFEAALLEVVAEVGVDSRRVDGVRARLFSTNRLSKGDLEKLVATEDIDVFEQMMSRRNAELELEARDEIATRAAGSSRIISLASTMVQPQLTPTRCNADRVVGSDCGRDKEELGYVNDDELRLLFKKTEALVDCGRDIESWVRDSHEQAATTVVTSDGLQKAQFP